MPRFSTCLGSARSIRGRSIFGSWEKGNKQVVVLDEWNGMEQDWNQIIDVVDEEVGEGEGEAIRAGSQPD
jgi:hypothetical protein